jgi:hypothetical protein
MRDEWRVESGKLRMKNEGDALGYRWLTPVKLASCHKE